MAPLAKFAEVLSIQRSWSREAFGPGLRTEGNCQHIEKELAEIRAEPLDVEEWIDVAMLAFDGALRTGATPDEVIDAYVAKLRKNMARKWPKTVQDQPSFHIKGVHV